MELTLTNGFYILFTIATLILLATAYKSLLETKEIQQIKRHNRELNKMLAGITNKKTH